jgi:hypothetical protein
MRNSSFRPQKAAGHNRERGVRALLTLTLCLLLGPGATAARGAGETDDLDASIEAALSAVAPERTAEAIRFLLGGQLGAVSVHAVSPGSLWDHDAAEQDQIFDAIAEGYFPGTGASATGGCRYVPLHLRGDATITGLVILFVDETNGGDFAIELRRKQTASNANAEVLASAVSTGNAPGHRIATDLTIVNGAIDNDGFAYFLWVCIPYLLEDTDLHGIYLSYTY